MSWDPQYQRYEQFLQGLGIRPERLVTTDQATRHRIPADRPFSFAIVGRHTTVHFDLDREAAVVAGENPSGVQWYDHGLEHTCASADSFGVTVEEVDFRKWIRSRASGCAA